MVKRNKYHIQLKRTKLPVGSSTIQNYGSVFGEPIYLNNEKRLTIGPPPVEGTRSTPIPNCSAVKLVSQNLQDPDDSLKYVSVVEQGVHYKNRNSEDVVNLTDNTAHKIYPITTMSAILSDGTYELSEYLLNKLNIDVSTLVPYPSLGVDNVGVYVDDFEPVVPQEVSINQTLADIVNSKVSIDENSAVTRDLALGVDLIGAYVRMPGQSTDDLNFIKTYIDSLIDNSIGTRLLALEGNIYYLQEMFKNVSWVHVGPTPPAENNGLWIDTNLLIGGLKYCSDKTNDTWSHVPVAYT